MATFGLMMLVTCILASLQGAGQNQNPNPNGDLPSVFYGLISLMLVGTPILGLFAILGYFTARRGMIRVWLDKSLNRARQENAWPPDYSSGLFVPDDNKARLAWISTQAILILGSVSALCIVAIFADLAVVAIVLAVESLMIPLFWRSVLAQHPADCWGIPDPGSSC